MKEATVVIGNLMGLHLRSADKLMKTATRFQSEVFVRRDDVEVNAKSLLGLLMLAAETGASLTVRAEGPDEEDAVAAVVALVEERFGEE